MQLELIVDNEGFLSEAEETYLIDEALEFIRHWYDAEHITEIAFSGGKDSIVLYDLCKKAVPDADWNVSYCNTTIEPPEVLKFVKEFYPEVKMIQAPPFFKMMRQKGIPLRSRRWCCDSQKKNISPKVKTFCGIRKFESCSREARGRIVKHTKEKIIYNPIFHWNTTLVWEYIKSNNLLYPSLYDEGFARIGCVVCPYVTGKNAINHQARWPKHWAAFKEAFRYVWIEKERQAERQTERQTEIYAATNWEDCFDNWMMGLKLLPTDPDSEFEFVFDGEILDDGGKDYLEN